MIKAVVIGSSGHFEYALDAKEYGVDIIGVSKGHELENMQQCIEKLNEYGYRPVEYDNVQNMLDIAKPDVAIINSIMNYNCAYSIMCLQRNIHVFCEKPIASSLQELEELRNIYLDVNKSNRVVFAGMFELEYESHFQTAKKIIDEGIIGEIRLVQAQKSYKLGTREWYYSNRETYPGTIPWVSIHALDWIYGVCGLKFDYVYSSQSCVGNNGNGTLEMTCASSYKNSKGQIAMVTSDYFRPKSAPTHDDDRLRVVGVNGIVEVSNKQVTLLTDNYNICRLSPKLSIFGDFIQDIMGNNACNVNFDYSYEVTKVALLSRESAEKNEVVKIL